MNYVGDFAVGQEVYIWFNTFDSNDPSASVTMTTFIDTDVHIHKDDSLTQRNNAAGVAVDVDVDTIAGIHKITIQTADNTVADFYEAGHDYAVRIEGATVDGALINPVVGTFSIANRRVAGEMGRSSIATLASQTSFTLTSGEASADNDAYNNCLIIVTDQVTRIQKAIGLISDYVGTTRTITLEADPGIFTMAVGDSVEIVATSALSNVRAVSGTTQTAGDIPALVTTVDTVVDGIQTDLDNGTDGLGAIKTDTAAILVDTGTTLDGRIPTALVGGRIDATIDATGMESGAVDNIWNRDATSNQTAGTFGEALGDPAATGESIRQLVGEFDVAAAAGDPSTAESVMQYLKQIVNVLTGATGIVTMPAAAAPANNVSIAEMVRSIYDDTNALDATKIPDTISLANINAECDTAISDAALATAADILDKLGAVNEAAAAGDPSATESVMQYVKQIVNILTGTTGITTMPAAAAPANNVSIAEMVRAIFDDTNSLDGTKIPDTVSLANINAEVDTALDTAISELSQAAPSATPTVRTALMLLYMALRNRLDVNTSGSPDVLNVYNDAGTVIAKKQVTDDGSDYSEAEMETGP